MERNLCRGQPLKVNHKQDQVSNPTLGIPHVQNFRVPRDDRLLGNVYCLLCVGVMIIRDSHGTGVF